MINNMAGRIITPEDLTVEDENTHCDCCRQNREHLTRVWNDGIAVHEQYEKLMEESNNTPWKRFARWIKMLIAPQQKTISS